MAPYGSSSVTRRDNDALRSHIILMITLSMCSRVCAPTSDGECSNAYSEDLSL